LVDNDSGKLLKFGYYKITVYIKILRDQANFIISKTRPKSNFYFGYILDDSMRSLAKMILDVIIGKRKLMGNTKGFSLIELLIVIAIVSIITAIAVPNLMSANIRAKVSGVKADMGSIAIALEDYKVDYGEYPKDSRFSRPSTNYASDVIAEPNQDFDGKNGSDDDNDAIGLGYLVYPKANFEPVYLKRIAGDPFDNSGEEDWNGTSGAHNHHYLYYTGKWDSASGTSVECTAGDSPQYWALVSWGPDKDEDITSYIDAKTALNDGTNLYNPDSGITSDGDIVIIGP